MGKYWDDDAAVVAFHLLGLGPDRSGPACSRCGRPVDKEHFDCEEECEDALGVRLCKACYEDTKL